MKEKDKPSYPYRPSYPHDLESDNGYPGLTKREYFAAMAMQGILASGAPWSHDMDNVKVTREAVEIADKILEELNNNKS